MSFEELVSDSYQNNFIPWLEGWIAVASDPASPLKVTWLRYAAGGNEIHQTALAVLTSLSVDYPILGDHARRDFPLTHANFVVGDDEAWRKQLSRSAQEQLWQVTPEPIRELLTLRR